MAKIQTDRRPGALTHLQVLDIPEAARESAIVVPRSLWSQIMSKMEKCGDSSPAYESFAWACVSTAVSAALAAAALPFSVTFSESKADGGVAANVPAIATEFGFGALTLAAIGSSLVAFSFARRHRADRAILRESVLDDMKLVADRCPEVPTLESSPTP